LLLFIVEQNLVGISAVMLVVFCCCLEMHDAPLGHYVKTLRYPQNRKHITYRNVTEQKRASAADDMLQKFDQVRLCGF